MSDTELSWAEVVMARLRETPCRYGFETADAAKIRRQMEREDGAVVIAQLLAEVAALKAQRQAADESLREERDKAQRELCSVLSGFDPRKAKAFAKRRGWDCFKEDGK
jgi:hypothetical protein